MKKYRKTLELYLGWDGAYVLSKHPLVVERDLVGASEEDEPLYYLTTSKAGQMVDDLGPESVVFRGLRLKKHEVVRLKIEVVPLGAAQSKPTKRKPRRK